MIPLRDNIPHIKKPIVTVSLLIINVLVFMHEISLGHYLKDFLYLYGLVPRNVSLSLGLFSSIRPFFTNMFLHAGWMHLIGNMWFLWIFADNVEDEMGHLNFLIFYIACGVIASLSHFIINRNSAVPAVGASGAIAGVLGAYMMLFPSARVLTLIPFFVFMEVVEIPAFIFLGIWFIYQFLLGVSSIGVYGAGIAFWAHIGGFLAGIFLLRFFVKRKRQYYY